MTSRLDSYVSELQEVIKPDFQPLIIRENKWIE